MPVPPCSASARCRRGALQRRPSREPQRDPPRARAGADDELRAGGMIAVDRATPAEEDVADALRALVGRLAHKTKRRILDAELGPGGTGGQGSEWDADIGARARRIGVTQAASCLPRGRGRPPSAGASTVRARGGRRAGQPSVVTPGYTHGRLVCGPSPLRLQCWPAAGSASSVAPSASVAASLSATARSLCEPIDRRSLAASSTRSRPAPLAL